MSIGSDMVDGVHSGVALPDHVTSSERRLLLTVSLAPLFPVMLIVLPLLTPILSAPQHLLLLPFIGAVALTVFHLLEE